VLSQKEVSWDWGWEFEASASSWPSDIDTFSDKLFSELDDWKLKSKSTNSGIRGAVDEVVS
jgi:hypothetical protein